MLSAARGVGGVKRLAQHVVLMAGKGGILISMSMTLLLKAVALHNPVRLHLSAWLCHIPCNIINE